MAYETDLDTAFTILLGKAQGTITSSGPAPVPPPSPSPGGGQSPVVVATSYTLMVTFGGGGSALAVATTDPQLVEVPDPGEIVWVHLYAGNATGQPEVVTASIELQTTSFATFGGSSPIYGSGSPPSITDASKANASIVGWFPHLNSGDALIARLTSFTGNASWLALAIRVRRDNTAQNQLAVLDAGGDAVLDASGNPIIYRS